MAGGATLREDDARRLWLVRSVELHDNEHALLTRDDRTEAETHAKREVSGTGRKAQMAYLAARSEFAAQRLEGRHPAIARALALTRFPKWMRLLPALAFVAGALSNELDGGNRLELLAFPLLGVIAWNLVVYVWLIVGPLLTRRRAEDGKPRWWQRLANPLASMGGGNSGTLTSDVLGSFVGDFTRAARSLFASRANAVMHLSAALFATGLIAGIFLRALTVEYRAGWESTFLGAAQVQAILAGLLGPASALTGIGIPDAAGMAALRWTEGGGGGVNAGPWIVLWTATVAAVVIVPRLILASLGTMRAAVLARGIAVPGREDFTVRRMLRGMGGGAGAGEVRVTPYAYTPDGTARDALETLLRKAMGEGAKVRFDTPCAYGAEEAWVAGLSDGEPVDLHLALFSLSATPEEENHATFVKLLAKHHGASKSGTRVAALVDEKPYRAHFAGQAGLADRIARRVESWKAMIDRVGARMLSVSLDSDLPPELAQRLEAELLIEGKKR